MSTPLRRLADLVLRESGITLAEHQLGGLRAALRRAAPGLEPADFLRQVADPARRGVAIAHLIDEVTVQESFFFREPVPLEQLPWRELLSRAQASGHSEVRVWVAGCAAGEEAYTIAMLASEAFAPAPPPVSILATDVSRRALDRAHSATYGQRAVRDVSAERRARWLRPSGDSLVVREEVRRLVSLRRHNLVTEPAPPPGEAQFQVVTCRNVLIYFDRATPARVAGQLQSALTPDGILVLGSADVLAVGGGARLRASSPAVQDRAPVPVPAPSAWRQTAGRRPAPVAGRKERLARARAAADAGRVADALAEVDGLVRADPLDAEAHMLRGVIELSSGEAGAAVTSLRRALYADPCSAMAAFMLGRAHDAAGRPDAARAAYAQALRTLEPAAEGDAAVFGTVDFSEIEAVCQARLAGGE